MRLCIDRCCHASILAQVPDSDAENLAPGGTTHNILLCNIASCIHAQDVYRV